MNSYLGKLAYFLTFLVSLVVAGCASGPIQGDGDLNDYAYRDDAESRRPASLKDRDIYLGMTMKQVSEIWGEPQDVATAGETNQGNQRWSYYTGAMNPAWSMAQPRVVYFEAGRVSGWKAAE